MPASSPLTTSLHKITWFPFFQSITSTYRVQHSGCISVCWVIFWWQPSPQDAWLASVLKVLEHSTSLRNLAPFSEELFIHSGLNVNDIYCLPVGLFIGETKEIEIFKKLKVTLRVPNWVRTHSVLRSSHHRHLCPHQVLVLVSNHCLSLTTHMVQPVFLLNRSLGVSRHLPVSRPRPNALRPLARHSD